jgi:predicted ribosomally synthesized peptide with SipW-like signal peptide
VTDGREESHVQDGKRLDFKIGLTMLILALVGLVLTAATWSAFSDTTDNDGNEFQAGSVAISDNDGGTRALLDLFASSPYAAPGATDSGCIKVSFDGDLASTVKVYGSIGANALADDLNLKIIRGTGNATNQSCASGEFTEADATGTTDEIYSDTLAAFMAAHTAYGDGLGLAAGGDSTWSAGESVTYKFQLSLPDPGAGVIDNAANSGTSTGHSTGNFSFTWEARNQ